MNYPATRHYQRYEYIVMSDLADNKNIIDIGCGHGYGTNLLAKRGLNVLGIDPTLPKNGGIFNTEVFSPRYAKELNFLSKDLYNFKPDIMFDLAVSVEVFEHMPDPLKFITKLSEIANEIFLTTPLAQKTAPTRNPDHIAEYSYEDFISIVSTKYNPQRIRFQTGDLGIDTVGTYTGDSMDVEHTVQMVYATRK